MGDELKRQRKHSSRKWILLFKAFCISLVLGVLAGAALLTYLYATSLPMAESDRNSRLLDSSGAVIATFSSGGKDSIPVQLNEIAPSLVDATLAVEDRKFYDHYGFDFKGLGRAVLVNLKRMDMAQGASTLTQQLARNLYLSHEKTWNRKLKEAMYTAQLEMKYSKHDILNMYLNEIYYGHGAYGIEAASQMYFGIRASELTLAESAMLAGIPKGPTYYSPYNQMKNAKDRQKVVLEAMVDTGTITRQEADAAYQQTLPFKAPSERRTVEEAPYFRDYVKNVVTQQLGISPQLLDHGGLNIYTTLDSQMQQAAESAVAKGMDAKSELETALVSIDPRTGYVKAMVGGKNYLSNQYNHALASTRQPGSSFKPIMYLTALDSGQMTGATVFNSQPTIFHYDHDRLTYQPKNFGDKFLGEINMRRAIAASDNIYAVNTIMKIGTEKVIAMARKMGISGSLNPVPSLALGTSPVSPFEMASAFAVISSGGQKLPATAVLRITDAAGRVVYEAPQNRPEQVASPAAAYVLTRMMESVFESGGTGNRVANVMKRPVAGKSGTTDTDAWMVGFTPELSTAVWVGYDKGKAIQTADGHRAAPIFAQYTEQALTNVPPKIFPVPDGVVSVYIDPQSGKLATAACPQKQLEVFVAGSEPKEYCSDEGTSPPQPQDKQADLKKEKHSWWSDFKRWWMN
ncbi:PBP1A family penicillin-binding protein [Paenibacillus sp. JX-17]|uniref:PBP1A family penicillin-binding protein n=1 Tax=Paenibacillus lacisoli TaxID=3064525 RepID=A0ABT9CJG3_9BACL|nr:PBP1A family penicillin-binding protein [Paenibacillus sp. JX-17]MDO7908678.1 PBP1A family penicillin-binding protein [Paenibacillus sp. JX-17]